MLLQQVIDLRGTGQQLQQALAGLGQGIRQIAAPNEQRKRQIENFLLQNPELARGLRRRQRRLDQAATSTSGAVEAGGEEAEGLPAGEQVSAEGVTVRTEPGNVLEFAGFTPEETRETLARLAPPQTPEEQLSEEQARARLAEGVPGAVAEAEVATAEAQEEKSELDLEKFSTLDGGLLARAQNAQAQTAFDMNELEQEQITDYTDFRASVKKGEVPWMSWAELRLAEQNPNALQDLRTRERMEQQEEQFERRMSLREEAQRIDQLENARDRAMAKFELGLDMRDRVRESVDRITEAREEGQGSDVLKTETQMLNQEISMLARTNPEMAADMVGIVTEGFWGGTGVEFRPTPEMIGSIADQPKLIKYSMDVLASARGAEPREGENAGDFVKRRTGELIDQSTKEGKQIARLRGQLSSRSWQRFLDDYRTNLRGSARDVIEERQQPPAAVQAGEAARVGVEFSKDAADAIINALPSVWEAMQAAPAQFQRGFRRNNR